MRLNTQFYVLTALVGISRPGPQDASNTILREMHRGCWTSWKQTGKAGEESGQPFSARKLLEEHGPRIATPGDRSFETEGEAIESGFRRTLESRDAVVPSPVRAAYRFRDVALIG